MKERLMLAMVLVLLAPAVPTSAQPEEPISRSTWPAWSFQWENDAFAVFSGSDEQYTNGVRLTVLRNPDAPYRWVPAFRDRFCAVFCPPSEDITTLALALGQNFYTPAEISDPDPQPLDRPWAGWLYGAAIVQITDSALRWQHVVELDFGVVGPAAGARVVQTEVHRLIDDELPLGWHNQIRNEPGLNLIYLYNRRAGSERADVVGHGGFALGTVMTYVNAGGTVRLGRNISAFPITPIPATAAPTAFGERAKWEAWAFAGVDGRWILHNIFLDGGFFRDSPGVAHREDWVYDLRAGFFVRRERWGVTYTFFRRSEELTPPFARGDGIHDVGSLTISYMPRLRQ